MANVIKYNGQLYKRVDSHKKGYEATAAQTKKGGIEALMARTEFIKSYTKAMNALSEASVKATDYLRRADDKHTSEILKVFNKAYTECVNLEHRFNN